MKTVLHVGCGPQSIMGSEFFQDKEQWKELRLDIDPSVQPQIVASMTDMAPIANGSMDVVFSSHNLEHLYPHEVGTALAEFRRVLKDDGYVLCLCPDLQMVATLVADGFLEEPAYITQAGYPIAPLDILYGWRLALAQGQMHMAHHCGFTEKSLANAFLQAGFRSVAMRRQRRLLQLAASASVRPLSDVQVQDMLAAHIGPAQ